MTHAFDWNTLYLTCFGIGLLLSVVSFLTGTVHLHVGHFHLGAHALPVKGAPAPAGNHHALSWLNAFTITGFLCWFGGSGYLLHRYSGFLPSIVFLFAALCGLAGAGILLWFLTGVLMKHERALEPADTEIVGVLGRISQPVGAGRVGEMLYTQNGARRSVGVRSADGSDIPREAEVVVMSFTKGIAYVRRWSEFEQGLMSGDGDGTAAQSKQLREP